MIYHYVISIVLITILLYKFYKIIKNTKLYSYTNDFIIKSREWNSFTTVSLIFSFLCLLNLIFSISILISDINWLDSHEIKLNLSDLLVPHKYRSLIVTFSNDVKDALKLSSLIQVRKNLFSSFYSILFIFLGTCFFFENSIPIYINNDGIYKLGKLYRWDTNRLHQRKKLFGRNLLNANVLNANGKSGVISFILYNDDKDILETLIGIERFTDNTE